jgi:hypothetical protein
MEVGEGRGASFCPHFILKMIILPRHARDRHRKNSKRDAFSLPDSARRRIGLRNFRSEAPDRPIARMKVSADIAVEKSASPKLHVSSRGRVNLEMMRSNPSRKVTEQTKSSNTSSVKRVIEEHLWNRQPFFLSLGSFCFVCLSRACLGKLSVFNLTMAFDIEKIAAAGAPARELEGGDQRHEQPDEDADGGGEL